MCDMPLGFSSAAMKSGLKNNDYDLAIIKSDPPSVVSAVYTQNNFQAAPIIFSKKNDKNDIQLLIVNSKIANALTGKKGYDDVLDVVKYAAETFNIKKDNILMASTGIIGVPLETEKIKKAIKISDKYFNNNFDNISKAIQTRDKFDKIYTAQLEVSSGKTANFYAIAKGSSIIHPNMATVLLFIFTDLNIEKETLDKAFRESINKTLNRISVDGETSTNDMALIMANGALNNKIITEKNKKLFKELKYKLDEICAYLAKMIILDGEGITKTIIVSVKRAKTQSNAFDIAKKIATSNLVKILFLSKDPNFEKILSVVGNCNININNIALYVNDVEIYKNGIINKYNIDTERKENYITIDLGYNTKYEDYYYFTDLTQEYISIHSSYNI
ncbi:bifunctional glutamate N-acetyltransferase/amino-acid acetyltransferase ArgJ [Brachyspira hampsonii]|uniref:Arginine biosynthesis bifunctional protein ArgJ n=1 Tax=Brachyspira hampsonii TaxID=1287055 RepID=A0AAC9TV75_9SPIR|nr:bifunctional glutamate N-acetyltransferase/amino-acid acetyltransferase ArgJ [Brachyspira hampsonii]ASJ21392.1 bifunctional ornithine acetyltransferase/N-acetylglutamate synthase [Brachyspira hampsonii]ELV05598.1 bifunctional ornithine acetyltransferase/N-acetylglutamate synthase protein [Brachyspira hampsonii 30599]MBW5379457.1 bifunctional glutamate N-acetyltransferase/amino-acid acetyltransferase ArgJ [Brachyspira hampsonii]MBW5410548.1 bifunctional glutamate N-acetyltransferase/amino-aci